MGEERGLSFSRRPNFQAFSLLSPPLSKNRVQGRRKGRKGGGKREDSPSSKEVPQVFFSGQVWLEEGK